MGYPEISTEETQDVVSGLSRDLNTRYPGCGKWVPRDLNARYPGCGKWVPRELNDTKIPRMR